MKMLHVIEGQAYSKMGLRWGIFTVLVKCPLASFAWALTEHACPVLVHALPCLGAFSGGVFYGSLGTKND